MFNDPFVIKGDFVTDSWHAAAHPLPSMVFNGERVRVRGETVGRDPVETSTSSVDPPILERSEANKVSVSRLGYLLCARADFVGGEGELLPDAFHGQTLDERRQPGRFDASHIGG